MVTRDMVIIYRLAEYDASFSRSYLLNMKDKTKYYTHAKYIKQAKIILLPHLYQSHHKITIIIYLPHLALNNLQ
jgi:hypothetical protein